MGSFGIFLFHEISHSFLESGVGVIGGKRDLVQPNLWSDGTWKSLTWLAFSYVNMRHFLMIIYEHLK